MYNIGDFSSSPSSDDSSTVVGVSSLGVVVPAGGVPAAGDAVGAVSSDSVSLCVSPSWTNRTESGTEKSYLL